MTHVLPTDADNSSNRPPLDGGFNTGAGPLLGDAIHTPNNVIRFPRPVSSLGSAANSRAQQREPFIDLHEFATGFFLGCFVALAAVLICIGFFGYRAFVA
jgi:hypothetical protein